MVSCSFFKNTVLLLFLTAISCGSSAQKDESNNTTATTVTRPKTLKPIINGADNYDLYLPLLKGKNVGIVTNQTGLMADKTNLVDFLLSKGVAVKKIFAPEHGFRGTADAGEHIADGRDSKTGLPVISLYGDNKKPAAEQLKDIEVIVFDLQDVGARFYTYISTLHYIMESCAENKIGFLVLDRPNPNGGIVDGPILEKEYSSFVGMHPIPILHGMTIGEYAQMINGEKWLKNAAQCMLMVVPCKNYAAGETYSLPVPPSPNLPNDQAVNLYPSLCLFEGTNVSVGRGTNKQFQIYGSPYLPKNGFSFTPMPNIGAKTPPYNGVQCFGEDLSAAPKINRLELKWLIKAYGETSDKTKFFTPFFTKLAGTKTLQRQIESGMSEAEIRKSWENGLASFRKMREKYLIY